MAFKVYIDPGHGGFDNGAQYGQRLEKDEVLRLALAVGEILQNDGLEVGYTRTADVYNSPIEKAQIANRNDADLFVSIHRNASPNPNMYSGVQTLIYDDSGIKADMARNINTQLSQAGFNDLGISVRPNLAILKKTKMPAVLVEVGFINSDIDNQIFDQNFDEIANAIAQGILVTLEETAPFGGYAVQIGLYRNYANALYELRQVQQKDGYEAAIVPWNNYFAVQVGVVDRLDDAVELEKELRDEGYDTLIVRVS